MLKIVAYDSGMHMAVIDRELEKTDKKIITLSVVLHTFVGTKKYDDCLAKLHQQIEIRNKLNAYLIELINKRRL